MFRKAYVLQGGDPRTSRTGALFPIGPIVALVMRAIVIVGGDSIFTSGTSTP
ncbi:hypothetical protein QJS66_16425 [Kocuria rhizophila]|nr:hypothetical protein QJS66_16425 [Kocuria rhizophila]